MKTEDFNKNKAATTAGRIIGTVIGWFIIIFAALVLLGTAAAVIKLAVKVFGWIFSW